MQAKVIGAKRRGGRPRDDTPNPVDVHVGQRLRLRRTLLGISQDKLGETIGLTFQQVQKYERGVNRIGASRLFELSRLLDVPVSFFFEEMPEAAESEDYKPMSGDEPAPAPPEPDPMARRETLELIRAYHRIPDANLRRRLFELTKAMADFVPGKSD